MTALVLLCFAFVFGCIAAFWQQSYGRVHFGWLATTLLLASMIWGRTGF